MESPIPEKYLPIGSVVRLVNGTKKIMIFGRLQIQASSWFSMDKCREISYDGGDI